MLRTVRSAVAAAALTAGALAGFAGTAGADAWAAGAAPVISCDGQCQIAGSSINDAGRDNIISAGNTGEMPGVGDPNRGADVYLVNNTNFPLTLVSREGRGDYPDGMREMWARRFEVGIPSKAEYMSDAGTVTIHFGDRALECSETGDLYCQTQTLRDGTVFIEVD